jgi:hypothetical protein
MIGFIRDFVLSEAQIVSSSKFSSLRSSSGLHALIRFRGCYSEQKCLDHLCAGPPDKDVESKYCSSPYSSLLSGDKQCLLLVCVDSKSAADRSLATQPLTSTVVDWSPELPEPTTNQVLSSD